MLEKGMSNRYRLVGLRDEQVLRGVSHAVAQVNALTADILAHLVEVDSRMLYAELGFPSLFSYCVKSLRLSEGAAGRRCAAARVCRRFPEAFELVAKGELHLSALCALSKRIEPDNAAELFEACRGRSRRRIDEILAARFPTADAKETIHRLREIEPTSADRYKVQFTADAKLRELIERACALGPDCSPQGQLARVITRGLELFVAQQEKGRFAVGRKPRKARVEVSTKAHADNATPSTTTDTPPGNTTPGPTTGTPPGSTPRATTGTPPGTAGRRLAIKAAVRRVVHERDQGRCAWVAQDGVRCSDCARLEFDHVEPWAVGSADDAANLRLLCPTHNRLHARHCFGAVHIAAKVAARRAAERRERY